MTREDAEREVARLREEHPDRIAHQWLAREGAEGWQVVRVALPPGMRIDPVKATTESKPRPPQADDPRPAQWRNVPPWGAGI